MILQNPVTKTGQIRYFEVAKLFLFVLFLFALYTRYITLRIEADIIVSITSLLTYVMVVTALTHNTIAQLLIVVHTIYQSVKSLFDRYQIVLLVVWEVLQETCNNLMNNEKNRTSEFCVYRC